MKKTYNDFFDGEYNNAILNAGRAPPTAAPENKKSRGLR